MSRRGGKWGREENKRGRRGESRMEVNGDKGGREDGGGGAKGGKMERIGME